MAAESAARTGKVGTRRDKTRNICIVAHVDHGKTTLSDSLLAYNGEGGRKKKEEEGREKIGNGTGIWAKVKKRVSRVCACAREREREREMDRQSAR